MSIDNATCVYVDVSTFGEDMIDDIITSPRLHRAAFAKFHQLCYYDPFDCQEGDLVIVPYGNKTRIGRVGGVVPKEEHSALLLQHITMKTIIRCIDN